MKKVKEIKINVPEGQLISVEVKDGVCTIRIEVAEELISEVKESEVASSIQEEKDIFVCIKASELSLDDEFMQYQPKTDREKDFKKLLTKVIKSRISDFYRPKIDPSFDKHGKICYQAGLKPALGKSYNWWERNAKEFWPERKSRLGTKSEYVAFLGVLIKKLVESGWSVYEAWDAVCNDSRKLGHYWDSKGALYSFEPTGAREICGFCDLGNTFKILAKDKGAGAFWLAGGDYYGYGFKRPLADLDHHCIRCNGKFSVGWLVLS